MRQLSTQNKNNETSEIEKTPTAVIRKIRDAILDETFKPGDWLPESELGERFGVSRSPVREALLALEEGYVYAEEDRGWTEVAEGRPQNSRHSSCTYGDF